jgi:tRNA (mo5U34)-methyltransferase
MPVDAGERPADLAAIARGLRWYHTLELPHGITTKGEYDLRSIVDRLPWPDLVGKRCLDIGGRDGFYAFEMERRGAAEVISLDIDDPAKVDFSGPPSARPRRETIDEELEAGNRAFAVAREALGSGVRRSLVSVYDIDRRDLGIFDFAVIGTLLLHLRDPVRALRSVREVIGGQLLVNEPIVPTLDSLRRRPLAQLWMEPGLPFWWIVNPAGVRRLLEAAGFQVEEAGRPYRIPYGKGKTRATLRKCVRGPLGEIPERLVRRRGLPHVWVLASPER